jgi:hypothetical protein
MSRFEQVEIQWGRLCPSWYVWQVLESANDLFLGVDPPPPKTPCATMCLVWNNVLNKLVHSGMCLAGGVDYMFKFVTLGICTVQLRRVKCVHADPLQRDGDEV